ncbi:MAG: hypothetical protein ABIR56_14960 [Polaromonas sp.]
MPGTKNVFTLRLQVVSPLFLSSNISAGRSIAVDFWVWRPISMARLLVCFGLIDMHDSTKRPYPAGEFPRRNWPRSAFGAKFYWSPIVGHFGQKIANTIHIMQAGCNPLVGAFAAINHGPYKVLIKTSGYLQIIAKGFESMSTPYIEVR